jgi:uncharacterized protein DUF4394/S-layer family protein
VCPIQFTDVPPTHPFYGWIRCLACRHIVGGYADGTFRPENNVTRGQISKMVSNSAGFAEPIPPTRQTYQDVPTNATFWVFIERLTARGIVGGYACGGPSEPCVPPNNRPYFRSEAWVTRGQLAKIVSGGAGFVDPIPTNRQTFQDIVPNSTFWVYIERLARRGIVTGYPCGGPGEPCVPPNNRPYYRQNNNATRGQASKIVAETFFPGCETPHVLWGITTSNRLISFNSAVPGSILTSNVITGTVGGEVLVGLDQRPAGAVIYAMGNQGRLYTMNLATGLASPVTTTITISPLMGLDFGFDFNPVADRIRIVSDADQNLRVNPDTGVIEGTDVPLQYAVGDPNFGQNPNVVGAAYNNNSPGVITTTLFTIDSNLDILVIQNPPNAGTLNTVGALGVNASGLVGFDIAEGTGIAFAALSLPSGSTSDLYRINLTTGAATLVNTIGGGERLKAMTVAPNPSPLGPSR